MNRDRSAEDGTLDLRSAAKGRFALLAELWLFVRATGKWWLVPVLVVLLLLGAVVLLSETCYAPFIYTLF